MERADEKNPAEVGGLSSGDQVELAPAWGAVEACKPSVEINDAAREALEDAANKRRQWARNAMQTADKQDPKDDFGRRFIEHGGMCYFNCWSLLRQCLDAASPPSSATPTAQ